jgi:hypothetical protein
VKRGDEVTIKDHYSGVVCTGILAEDYHGQCMKVTRYMNFGGGVILSNIPMVDQGFEVLK